MTECPSCKTRDDVIAVDYEHGTIKYVCDHCGYEWHEDVSAAVGPKEGEDG